MITMHARFRQRDRQTDGRTNMMEIARRFVLTTATMMCRKRRVGGRREVKAVSVEAVNAQAAFYHYFKSSSPTHNDVLESPRPPADPLPVQLNPDAPASGRSRLVSRTAGVETSGLAHCPVCYDVLVSGTGNRQQRGHVTAENDVTRRRPVMGVCGDAGRYLVTDYRNHINSSNSIYSV